MKQTFEEFWHTYARMHAHPSTRRMHALATASALTLVVVGIATRHVLLVAAAPIVDFAIAQVSHRVFERNKTRPWRAPVRHARAELRLFRQTLASEAPRLRQHLGVHFRGRFRGRTTTRRARMDASTEVERHAQPNTSKGFTGGG